MNLSRRMPEGVDVARSPVGGAPGIVLRIGDQALLAMSIEVQRGQIARVLSVANPDKPRGITEGPASIE